MSCAECNAATVSGAEFCGFCGAAIEAPPDGELTVVADLVGEPAVPTGPPPRTARDDDLTPYLCAAAYLDRDYARQLVQQIGSEPHLAVAVAPACDVPVVLRHAYAATARRHGRDVLLAVLLVLLLIFYGTENLPLTMLTLFAAWVTVFSFELSTLYGSYLQGLRPESFDPSAAPAVPDPAIEDRLHRIGAYATGNVSVYSGYSPFLGYGLELDSWSFALDVTKPGGPAEAPRDFDVKDLYAHVTDRLESLILPELVIEERLFVDGSAILDDRRFLPDPLGQPVAEVSPEQLDALKRDPEDRARPYLAVHSTGWRGQLVTSLFVRFYRSESNLSVEAVHTVLCPLQERYRVIDTLLPNPSVGQVLKKAAEAVPGSLGALLISPVRAVQGFALGFSLGRRVRRQDRMIGELHRFDYGARISVRQQASDASYHRHFQKLDTKMALKIAERRVLDALVEFAENHGIDVSDLVQRQETIINNGIIATSGATVESSAVASGTKASISIELPFKLSRSKSD